MRDRDYEENKTKRDELLTYRNLKLGRELKSIARRKLLEASGKRCVLGDGSLSKPYLLVDRARYREVWRDMAKQLLQEAKRQGVWDNVDLLLPRLQPRIEALTYAHLAKECQGELIHSQTPTGLDRGLTARERKLFLEAKNFGFTQGMAATNGDAALLPSNQSAQFALDNVLAHVSQRQDHNPARYGAIWAELVGLDAASQTEFVRVDETTETAYFRCLNSVLSMSLQRRNDLPKKLGAALGKKIRRLKAQF